MSHHHLCPVCHVQRVPCDGTWERNPGGAPEVICSHFHLPNGELADVACAICRDRQAQEEAEQDAAERLTA